jgi:3-oxoacyl-[acyl-carrier-protein] synthase-3
LTAIFGATMSTCEKISRPVFLCGIGWDRTIEKTGSLPGKNGEGPVCANESLTGIRTRSFAQDLEPEDLALRAVRDLFGKCPGRLKTVDFLLLTSTSPGTRVPSTASLVAGKLFENPSVPSLDIGGSCSGSIVALSVGAALISSGDFRNVLIVSTEKKTAQLCPRHGPETALLFGDMATAALLSDTPDPLDSHPPFALRAVRTRSRGDLAGLIWKESDPCDGSILIRMNGPRVFREAITTLTQEIPGFLQSLGLDTKDLRMAVFHQANGRLLAQVGRKLGLPADKIPLTLAEYGNTSSSSTFLTLGKALEDRGTVDGPVLLATFGGGVTWGMALLERV